MERGETLRGSFRLVWLGKGMPARAADAAVRFRYHICRYSANAPPGRPVAGEGRWRRRLDAVDVHRSQVGGLRGIVATQTSVKTPQCGQRRCHDGLSTAVRTMIGTASRVSTIIRRFLAAGCRYRRMNSSAVNSQVPGRWVCESTNGQLLRQCHDGIVLEHAQNRDRP